jgi:SNF2 family DNA or RNA helicase
MQNNLNELHTLITLLKPGHLGSRNEFSAKHMVSARQAKDTSQLKGHLHRVMIRNKRRDGVIQLPNRHVSAVSLELSAEERILYDAVQKFLKSEYYNRKEHRLSVLPLVTLQREICSSPYAAMMTMEKMMKRSKDPDMKQTLSELLHLAESVVGYTKVDKVLQMLSEIEGKCIIFTEYRATQDFLMYMLKKHGVSAVPFRGGFGRGKKDWMKDLFAKKVKVLVATESGGEGINLQFCNRMINFDLPWNPMRLEQRIGRIHRLGQNQEVNIYNLSTKDTIEQHIVELLQEKIRMFESVIGELDYIVDDKPIANKLDEEILDMAMSSESDQEFKDKLDSFGNQVLSQIQGGGAGVD